MRGVVQGVGFRPFVYRLASEEGLAGFIGNDTDGVTIEIEGPAERVEAFRVRLCARGAAAFPHRFCNALAKFRRRENRDSASSASEVHGQVSTGIPADAATCADCLRELLDPADRRYRYPFLNCTNCGPRFTITRRIPYDRPQTSMAQFKMCPACQAEYDDPAEPPLSCAAQRLLGLRPAGLARRCADGAEIPCSRSGCCVLSIACWPARSWPSKASAAFISSVDATNEAAVMRLRERKHRYGKPLAVMVRDLMPPRASCASSRPRKRHCCTTPARPIVLARAAANIRGIAPPSRPAFRGWASFCPMRRCSICSLPIRVFARWS